ncbi:uncharacterized protein LOC117100834 [Anneissia japonica]|uniref:uncharacterized protein LOC117100834 n=1 Tax=Anneissia japonica TaxID=1529436 RepID=UPI0014255390|nr:uncharacterized protein LOC117100834 [Anneissia japonica]
MYQDFDVDNMLPKRHRRPPSRYGFKMELNMASTHVDRELPSCFHSIVQTNPSKSPLVQEIGTINRYRQLKLAESRSQMAARYNRNIIYQKRMQEYQKRVCEREAKERDIGLINDQPTVTTIEEVAENDVID